MDWLSITHVSFCLQRMNDSRLPKIYIGNGFVALEISIQIKTGAPISRLTCILHTNVDSLFSYIYSRHRYFMEGRVHETSNKYNRTVYTAVLDFLCANSNTKYIFFMVQSQQWKTADTKIVLYFTMAEFEV